MSLTNYFHHILKSKGYFVEKALYDVSFSQGSGCAFYGQIGYEGLWTLCERLLSGHQQFAAYRTANESVVIDIHRNNHHYCHENTMDISHDVECYYYPDDDESDLTELEYDSFNELIDCIEKDVIDIATDIHHKFEQLFLSQTRESETVFQFKTKQYLIKVHKFEDEYFFQTELDEIDNKYIQQLIDLAVDNNLDIYALKCEIYDNHTNQQLIVNSDYKFVAEIKSKQLRQDVFHIIRNTIQDLKLK